MSAKNRKEKSAALAYQRLHFVACENIPEAQDVFCHFIKSYGQASPEDADAFVVLGGDGFMLHTLHQFLNYEKPFYGINYGSVGFLMNSPCLVGELLERLNRGHRTHVNLLKMQATTLSGTKHEAWAFNEISLLRETYQAAKIAISVNGKPRLQELICDGVLVSTPAGSTAYNFSAHGPILPIGSRLLALTPISAFRPRRWRGAVLPHDVVITLEVLDPVKRPVSVVADDQEIRQIKSVSIFEDEKVSVLMLFDAQHNLEERILAEQFYAV
ncbi:MAG: NAD kinase [Alphaproteobacteria bacterium]